MRGVWVEHELVSTFLFPLLAGCEEVHENFITLLSTEAPRFVLSLLDVPHCQLHAKNNAPNQAAI